MPMQSLVILLSFYNDVLYLSASSPSPGCQEVQGQLLLVLGNKGLFWSAESAFCSEPC